MLAPTLRRLKKAMFTVGVVAAAAFSLSTSGCAALLTGDQDAQADFLVVPKSNGTFWGWTEITVGGDINSVGPANLEAITLQVEKPPGFDDLSFLASLQGEAVTASARTLVAKLDSFPRGEQAVTMDIAFQGDLHPLFKDQSTIRIEWTGSINPAFTGWPADGSGIWVKADVKIFIQ